MQKALLKCLLSFNALSFRSQLFKFRIIVIYQIYFPIQNFTYQRKPIAIN
ncbi:MAG: hypothetical protein ACJAUH_001458 [Saprospiraceae bacterium]|jgi:hypothetical protein